MPHLLLALVVAQLSLNVGFAAEILEKIDYDKTSQFTCAQGLTGCRVRDEFDGDCLSGPVCVNQMQLKLLLCCRGQTDCKPCVQINVQVTVTGKLTHCEKEEQSGDGDDDDDDDYESLEKEEGGFRGQFTPIALTAVSMSLCYNIPPSIPLCKRLEFTLSPAVLEDHNMSEVWLSLVMAKEVSFDSVMTMYLYPSSFLQSITVPSKKDVCSPALQRHIDACDVPTLRTAIDWKKALVTLQLDSEGVKHSFLASLFMKYGRERQELAALARKWNHTEKITIPLASAVPCLCFQVWWMEQALHPPLRVESCPFMNQTELMKNVWDNITVSVAPAPMNNNKVALSWNLSTPCRVEAEVRLCRMMTDSTGLCEKEHDSQRLVIEKQKTDSFRDVDPHPYLCVLVKIKGMNTELGPFCPFAAPRSHFLLLAISIVLAVVLLGLAVRYLLNGTLKGWVWKWFKENDIKGTLKGAQVVLLCPPDPDPALPALVCKLGSSLSALGFTVSLDLWSSAELSALGPVPWLHSRLDCLQRHGGGKVVLLLTSAAWRRAEEWTRSGLETELPTPLTPRCGSPASADVFSASLSCVQADRLQGRAGKRFVLARFEALPPLPLGASHVLPELFQGMPLYSLPSQSLAFLTELAGGLGAQSRKRQAGRLRAGSRALILGLGAQGDLWETVPLKPCNIAPVASRITTGTNWV